MYADVKNSFMGVNSHTNKLQNKIMYKFKYYRETIIVFSNVMYGQSKATNMQRYTEIYMKFEFMVG